MKKILTMIIVLALPLAFVGCGSEKTQESSSSSSSSSSSLESTQESKETEYKVGDVINFEGEEVTVTNVEKNYDTGNQYLTPKTGNEFVKVTINIKNISNNEISVGAFEFELQNSKGSIENIVSPTYSLEDVFDNAKLVPGGERSGSMIFEAPKDDTGLKLVYKPSFLSSKELKINL